ncbi:hypothetical protein B4U79_16538 [Dinothrombium tinctorium]|uniref:C2 domain-containing protein n=1 Tax=Dinothrombium tinctorium TaxID=1965070 RepID=A0A3S4QGL1_9ACAR|nr:hypothetical protein B4U79_16538 [Dinothrombium tinctorium]
MLFWFLFMYLIDNLEERIEFDSGRITLTGDSLKQIFRSIAWDKILSAGKVEKVFWFNHILKSTWKQINNNIREMLIGLKINKYIEINQFELGSEPFWIQSVYSSSSGITRENFRDVIAFDIDLVYNSSENMKIQFTFFHRFIKGSISKLRMKANLKLIFKHMKWFPDEETIITEVVLCLSEQPLIYNLDGDGLFSVYKFFGVFHKMIQHIICYFIVYPRSIIIQFPDLLKHTPRKPMLRAPFGQITVDILETDLLRSAIPDLCRCRKPNPYCLVNIHKEKFRSPTILSTDSPWFNFKCSTYVDLDFNFQVAIEIFDNTFGQRTRGFTSELIAYTQLDVKKHAENPSKNGQSCWISLGNTERSRLHYRISCFVLSTSYKDILTSLQLASFGFPTGFLTVFVDSACGLTNFTRQKMILDKFNPFVSIRVGNVTFETPLSSQMNTPIWEHNIHFPVYNANLQVIFVEVIAKLVNGSHIVLGVVTIPIDNIFTTESDQVAVDREYKLKGITKAAYIRLVTLYKGALVPAYFIKNYQRNTKVAEQEISKATKIKKEKEQILVQEDKLKMEDCIYVKLKISWPRNNEIHVTIIEVSRLQKLMLNLKNIYVVLHLRYKQFLLQVKKSAIVKDVKKSVLINQKIIFKKITKNIRLYHLRVSVHTTRSSKYEFNKIAETYIQFPALSPGADFDESTYRLMITLPFKLMAKQADLEYSLDEEDDVLATERIPLSPTNGVIDGQFLRDNKLDDLPPTPSVDLNQT